MLNAGRPAPPRPASRVGLRRAGGAVRRPPLHGLVEVAPGERGDGARSRTPGPLDQRVHRHVVDQGRNRLAAVPLRVREGPAEFAVGQAFPAHAAGGEMPVWSAGDTAVRGVHALMAGRARHRRHAAVVGAAGDEHPVPVAVVASGAGSRRSGGSSGNGGGGAPRRCGRRRARPPRASRRRSGLAPGWSTARPPAKRRWRTPPRSRSRGAAAGIRTRSWPSPPSRGLEAVPHQGQRADAPAGEREQRVHTAAPWAGAGLADAARLLRARHDVHLDRAASRSCAARGSRGSSTAARARP